MKKFKDIMNAINVTFGSGFFGAGTMRMLLGDYKNATYLLFVVAILFVVGYFAERWSE